MYDFWYDYVKPNYGENKKSNWINERRTTWINHEKCIRLRAKAYSYLKSNDDENKKVKDTKSCVIERKLKFEDYKNC